MSQNSSSVNIEIMKIPLLTVVKVKKGPETVELFHSNYAVYEISFRSFEVSNSKFQRIYRFSLLVPVSSPHTNSQSRAN